MIGMAKRKHEPEPIGEWDAERIHDLRTRLGLTQADAAKRVAVGQAVWASWESGARKPSRQSCLLLDILSKSKKK